jgi:hypothetical protein
LLYFLFGSAVISPSCLTVVLSVIKKALPIVKMGGIINVIEVLLRVVVELRILCLRHNVFRNMFLPLVLIITINVQSVIRLPFLEDVKCVSPLVSFVWLRLIYVMGLALVRVPILIQQLLVMGKQVVQIVLRIRTVHIFLIWLVIMFQRDV